MDGEDSAIPTVVDVKTRVGGKRNRILTPIGITACYVYVYTFTHKHTNTHSRTLTHTHGTHTYTDMSTRHRPAAAHSTQSMLPPWGNTAALEPSWGLQIAGDEIMDDWSD